MSRTPPGVENVQSRGRWPRETPAGRGRPARGADGVPNDTGLAGRKGTRPRRSGKVVSTYERAARGYDRYWRRLWLLVAGRAAEQAMLEAVIRAAPLTGCPVVLDAGAGTGALSRRLVQARPDVHPVLVDLSPGMLARAADLHDPRVVASVQALPFADDTFDLVMSGWVIETVDSPTAAVSEMLRVLRPGGLVAYSFCSRPVRLRDRWRTGPTRAVVHALFAGHFLREEQTPFHDCAISRRSSFAAGAATIILLGKCCTVTDAKAERTLPPSHAGSLTEHPCGRTVRRP